MEAGGPMSNCYGYDVTALGLSSDEQVFIRNIALEAPLTAGQTMAFSIEHIAGNATTEFWGTSEECGVAAERLATAEAMAPNILCVELSGSADHSHLLMVWREGGGRHGYVTVCPAGSCPASGS